MNKICVALLLIVSAIGIAEADAADQRMNVLFLVADDLNSWMLEDADRYAGKVVAPNLRKLASSGVNFTRAYTAAPVCSPSRTAFFSGVAPWKSGIYNNAQTISKSKVLNRDDVLSLAGLFKKSGYDTVGYGKITHGWDQKEHWNEHVGHKRDTAPPGAPLAKAVSDGIVSFADKVIKSGKHKQAVQAYLATTTYVDTQIGRVLDALENSPYQDSTIVVFLTDHGLHLGEKLHWQKTTLWEEGTHTLLMFRAPGVTKAGGVSERFVSLMDIYPTLAELCGLTPPAYIDGHSLVLLLKDPKAPWDSTAITGLCTKGKQEGDAYISIRHELGRYTRYLPQIDVLAADNKNDPKAGDSWKRYQNYEQMFEQEDLDAVMIATPDHVRVRAAIIACAKGLDIYAEKPLSFSIPEGRALVKAVRKHKRVLQVGTQQRSTANNQYSCKFVRNGGLGKVHTISAAGLRFVVVDQDMRQSIDCTSKIASVASRPCTQFCVRHIVPALTPTTFRSTWRRLNAFST